MGQRMISGLAALLLFFAVSMPSTAQVIENYDHQLFHARSGGWLRKGEVISVQVDLASFPLADLQVKMPAGGCLFVEGELWFRAKSDTVFNMPLAEVQARLGQEVPMAIFEVYRKDLDISQVSVKKVGGASPEEIETEVSTKPDQPLTRDKEVFREFFFLALMIFLLLTALFKLIHPVVFHALLNPLYLFSSEDFAEGGSFNKFFSNALLYYLLLLNMVFMLVFMAAVYYLGKEPFGITLSNSLNNLFFVWILGALLLTAVSFIKFLWLKMTGFVFSVPKFESSQFLFMLRILTIGLILMIAPLGVSVANESQVIENLMGIYGNGFLSLYVLAMILLWMLMRKRLSFKNYHLFSYICTSELIPFLVITKLLVG